jgi:protein phosphatase
MKLLGATGSHVGNVRETNQDRVFFRSPVAVLADGMGGHQGGERAAQLAVERFEEATTLDPGDRVSLSENDLVDLVLQANRQVHGHAHDNGLPGMGTTVVAMTLHDDNTITVANVGDSRAYWLRGDLMGQVTEDHSFVEDLVRQGRLTPQEAAIHPQRNILTRAIGIGAEVEVDSFPIPEPEIGDRFLLCSDGLFNELPESEILEILLDSEHPADAATSLIEATLRTPCRDNVTVAVVELVADDDPRLDFEVEAQITVETDDDVQASVVTAPVSAAQVSMATQLATGQSGDQPADDRLGDLTSFEDTLVVSSVNGGGALATLLAEDSSELLSNPSADTPVDKSVEKPGDKSADDAAEEDGATAEAVAQADAASDDSPPSVRRDDETVEMDAVEPARSTAESKSQALVGVVGLLAVAALLIGGFIVARSIAHSGAHIAQNDSGGVTVFEGRRGGFLFFDPSPVADHSIAVEDLVDDERAIFDQAFDDVDDAEIRLGEIQDRIDADAALAAASAVASQGDEQEAGSQGGSQDGGGDASTNDSTDLQGSDSDDSNDQTGG